MTRVFLLEDEMPPVAAASHVQFGQRCIDIKLPEGLGDYEDIMDELHGYTQVLLGHEESPLVSPYLTLMEIATVYLARAYEIEMFIFEGEHTDAIPPGHVLRKLRTGPLQSFINMARKLADLGSRRLSQETLLTEQRKTEDFRR